MNPHGQIFKCLLKYGLSNYRITFTKEELDGFDDEWQSLSLDKFQSMVYRKYPSYQKFFNESNYSLQIYDKDFEEYVVLDDMCTVDNLSKILVVPLVNGHPLLKADFRSSAYSLSEDALSSSFNRSLHVLDHPTAHDAPTPLKKEAPLHSDEIVSSAKLCAKITTNHVRDSATSRKAIESVLDHPVQYEPKEKLLKEAQEAPCSSNVVDGKVKAKEEIVETDATTNQNQTCPLNGIRTPPVSVNEKTILYKSDRKVLYESDFAIPDLENKLFAFRLFAEKFNARFLSIRGEIWTKKNDIWGEIDLELQKASIDMDFRKVFLHCIERYVDIITYLVDWTEEECQAIWPLFDIFHNELLLSPFRNKISKAIENFDCHAKNNGRRKTYDSRCHSLAFSRHLEFDASPPKQLDTILPKEIENSDDNTRDVVYKSRKITLCKGDFKVEDQFEKDVLVDTIIYTTERLRKIDNCSLNLEQLWLFTSRNMRFRRKVRMSPERCRRSFSELLRQYKFILKHLFTWQPAACQRLWPFFTRFHYKIDIKELMGSVQQLRCKFNSHTKVKVKDVELDFKELDTPEGHSRDSLKEEETRLIKVVFKNVKKSPESLVDDIFWQKVAYELSVFSNPLNSAKEWKSLFYSLLHEYNRELDNNEMGPLRRSKLLDNEDLSIFLSARQGHYPQNDAQDGGVSESEHRMIAHTNRHRSGFSTDDDKKRLKLDDLFLPKYFKEQIMFLGAIKKKLKSVDCKPNRFDQEAFWKSLQAELQNDGLYLAVEPSQYFKSIEQLLMQVMRVSDTKLRAVTYWPLFEYVNSIDLTLLVEDSSYPQLRRKFV